MDVKELSLAIEEKRVRLIDVASTAKVSLETVRKLIRGQRINPALRDAIIRAFYQLVPPARQASAG